MVTVGSRENRCGRAMSRSATAWPRRTASAIASSPCASGIPYLRMMISVSTPGAFDVAQHFGDAADRGARGRRPARQLHRHHLAGRRAAFLAGRNEDVHQHASIERRDVAHAVLVAVVAADDPLVGALEDADDPAFDAAAILDPLDPDDDAIALHRLVEIRTRDVDIAAGRFERTFGRDEAVAGLVRLQPADVEIHFFRAGRTGGRGYG